MSQAVCGSYKQPLAPNGCLAVVCTHREMELGPRGGFWGVFGSQKEAPGFGSQAGTVVLADAAARGFPEGDGCGWARGGEGGFGDLPGGPAAEQLREWLRNRAAGKK